MTSSSVSLNRTSDGFVYARVNEHGVLTSCLIRQGYRYYRSSVDRPLQLDFEPHPYSGHIDVTAIPHYRSVLQEERSRLAQTVLDSAPGESQATKAYLAIVTEMLAGTELKVMGATAFDLFWRDYSNHGGLLDFTTYDDARAFASSWYDLERVIASVRATKIREEHATNGFDLFGEQVPAAADIITAGFSSTPRGLTHAVAEFDRFCSLQPSP